MASHSPNASDDFSMKWSHERTLKLIDAYERQTVLWNLSAKGYKDRAKKAAAWIAIERDTDVPIDTCKRKIESLLACVRRERIRILKTKADPNKETYESRWAYLKPLRFLPALKNIKDVLPKNSSDEDQEEENAPEWMPPTLKRQKLKSTKQSAYVETEGVLLKNSDEFDAIGVTVAAKLRKMDENQRIFAENIINKALYKGLLFQLNVNSDLEMFGERITPNSGTTSHRQDSHTITTHQQQQHQFSIAFSNPPVSFPQKSATIQEESEDEFKQVVL